MVFYTFSSEIYGYDNMSSVVIRERAREKKKNREKG